MSSLRRVPPPVTTYPNVLGTPGGSLNDLGSKFGAGQVAAGNDGEVRTARALADCCKPGGPTVLHDLILPMNKITANIDHIIISGKEVRILDSKMWAPGIYWTFAGHTRRGFTRCDHADKRTMAMATAAITKLLSGTGVRFVMKRPVLIVWPSSAKKQMSLWFFRPIGAKATTGARFTSNVSHYAGAKPANQDLVAALIPLVISLRNRDQKGPTPAQRAPFAPTPSAAVTFSPEPEFLPEPIVESTPVFPEPIKPPVPTKTVYASDDF